MQSETLSTFLASVVSLFNSVLSAVFAVPVLRFFLVTLLFLVAVSLAAWLIRQGQYGRL